MGKVLRRSSVFDGFLMEEGLRESGWILVIIHKIWKNADFFVWECCIKFGG